MPLEERDEALASVDLLLDDAPAGRGRLLLVEGPPGIGKTRLLGAITERARAAGMRTLGAQAGEFEQDFPYGIVRQLFEASIAGPLRDEMLNGAADLARPLFELAGDGALASADPTHPEISATVAEWTAGNPLLLRELIAAAVVRRIEPTPTGATQI
jgi:predicted ATPase